MDVQKRSVGLSGVLSFILFPCAPCSSPFLGGWFSLTFEEIWGFLYLKVRTKPDEAVAKPLPEVAVMGTWTPMFKAQLMIDQGQQQQLSSTCLAVLEKTSSLKSPSRWWPRWQEAYTLLTLYFLMSSSPPLVPNLQETRPYFEGFDVYYAIRTSISHVLFKPREGPAKLRVLKHQSGWWAKHGCYVNILLWYNSDMDSTETPYWVLKKDVYNPFSMTILFGARPLAMKTGLGINIRLWLCSSDCEEAQWVRSAPPSLGPGLGW